MIYSKPYYFVCYTQKKKRERKTLHLVSLCFRYAKVSEVMTCCTIGMEPRPTDEELHSFKFGKIFPFSGQIGPIYVFGDALSSEHVRGIYCLGPSYMYSFLGDEIILASDNSLYNGVLDAKDGLSAKIIFGLNAQVSVLLLVNFSS